MIGIPFSLVNGEEGSVDERVSAMDAPLTKIMANDDTGRITGTL